MNKHLLIYCIIITIVLSVIITDLLSKRKQIEPVIEQIKLTNIDGLLNDIDTLQLKSDTIKLYYEKKIYNYHILPRSERVKLFTGRINR